MNIRSNEPFWLVKNGLQNSYPSLKEDIETDALIIGGGITGALMAYECVQKNLNAVLIDKREIAYGSTSATTSMLQYEIDIPLYRLTELIGEQGAVASYKACRDSIYQLEAITQKVKSDCGFQVKQSLYFASSKKDLKWLKKEFEAREKAGFDVVWLNEHTIEENYGLKAFGGILSNDGASIDAFCLAHDILHYCNKKGLEIFDKTELQKVKYHDDFVEAKLSNGQHIRAKKVIYCTGYETQAMLPEKIVDLKSTYAVVSEQTTDLKKNLSSTLFWNTDSPYLYLRTTDENRILIGGEDENFKSAIKRDALLDRKSNKLQKLFSKLMPNQAFYEDFSWCGTFGETKDGLPYIGEHPKFPNSYFCLGFGGNGITFSVIGAKIIADSLQGKDNLLQYFFRFGR